MVAYRKGMIDEARIAELYVGLGPELNERQKRLWAASEARSHGRGGIAAVVRTTGIPVRSALELLDPLTQPRVLGPQLNHQCRQHLRARPLRIPACIHHARKIPCVTQEPSPTLSTPRERLRDDCVERPGGVTPRTARQHAIVDRTSESWPALLGYNRLAVRAEAAVLCTVDDAPLLAIMEYGRGRSLAWASDTGPHWCPDDLCAWPGLSSLWRDSMRWPADRERAGAGAGE